jgi:RES domain-containing protein
VRFRGICYRAHDPRWSFQPLSGEGAAIHGGRFNPQGVPTLYLSLRIETAIKEANQGLAFKIEPCVLCAYAVDCTDIVDLRTEAACAARQIRFPDLSCGWFAYLANHQEPPSWQIARRLIGSGQAGILVPSFAPDPSPSDQNLVLWTWSERRPHRVRLYDPRRRLPRNQRSWE